MLQKIVTFHLISICRVTDLLMIVDCLGPVVAERLWVVGQWRPQKCDCICGGKENLEEDRKEKKTKHFILVVLKNCFHNSQDEKMKNRPNKKEWI